MAAAFDPSTKKHEAIEFSEFQPVWSMYAVESQMGCNETLSQIKNNELPKKDQKILITSKFTVFLDFYFERIR